MPPQQDRSVVLVVVIGLVLIALAVVGAGVYLVAVGRELPQALATMGAVALGAVAGVLATTSTRPPPPVAVDPEQTAA